MTFRQNTFQTIPEMVLGAADRFGDAEAVVDGPLRLSFADVADRVLRAAGAFAQLGVDKGDRVAIWAPNSAHWMIAAFGALTAGAVVVERPFRSRSVAVPHRTLCDRAGGVALQPVTRRRGRGPATRARGPRGVPRAVRAERRATDAGRE